MQGHTADNRGQDINEEMDDEDYYRPIKRKMLGRMMWENLERR